MTQDPNIVSLVSQSIPATGSEHVNSNALVGNELEDEFFDHHASLLMHQQRSMTR